MSFEEFKELIVSWHKDTSFYSTYKHIADHKNLAKIIQDDDHILGYACLMLDSKYIHQIFIILSRIVKDPPPFNEYYAGRIPVMRECWKYWALKEGILFSKHDAGSYWVADRIGNQADWS